jgi:hypothetical protein
MSCTKIPNVGTIKTPVELNSITPRDLPDGEKIAGLLTFIGSNYEFISQKACQCVTGFSWDSKRLRCMKNTLQLP